MDLTVLGHADDNPADSAGKSASKSPGEGNGNRPGRHLQALKAPMETSREGIEVIRTFVSSAAARSVPKVVYGFAYRCIKCNGIWPHRVQALRHECAGVTILGL